MNLTKKNILVMHPTDFGACAFYRYRFVAEIIQAKMKEELIVVVSPFEITDERILKYTAAISIGRPSPFVKNQVDMIRNYKRKRNRFGFRLFADYDDLLFDIGNDPSIPKWNDFPESTKVIGEFMRSELKDFDGVTVTTQFLKQQMHSVLGLNNVVILPNAVPTYAFGKSKREPLESDIVKPRVLFAGAPQHYMKDDAGDFGGVWYKWLQVAVANDEIEFHFFGYDCPEWLSAVKDKVVMHDVVNTLEFPSVIASIKPDIYLAPLDNNNFNKAKSNLKFLEASAIGAVLLCSSFDGAPYEDDAHMMSKVTEDATVDDLRYVVSLICQKHVFNAILEYQNRTMRMKGYEMDNDHYLQRYLRVFFGDALHCNG